MKTLCTRSDSQLYMYLQILQMLLVLILHFSDSSFNVMDTGF
jgi:hypothetical protein